MQIGITEKQASACTLHLPVILLADDDVDDRALFAEALAMTEQFLKLVMVNDGEELIRYLKSSPPPQLIFLDLNMPRQNGAQCLTFIKSNQILSATPVVILSTSINEAKKNQLVEEGAAYCFNKPSEFSGLVTLLKKSLHLLSPESRLAEATPLT